MANNSYRYIEKARTIKKKVPVAAQLGYLLLGSGKVRGLGSVNSEPFDYLPLKLNDFVEQYPSKRLLYKPVYEYKVRHYLI